jgi:putative tryptophan/tyrosine transport system substrate-binding protein
MIRRREFITLLGGAAAAWPLAAQAQQKEQARRIGVLMALRQDDAEMQARVGAFKQELRKLGWANDREVVIIERWPADDMDRIRADAAEILAGNPDVILVGGRRAVAVLQQLTRTVPVIFAGIGDPVETGVVGSLARPGGNFTGFTLMEYSVIGKMLEMLKQLAPAITRVALIFNPDNPGIVATARSFEAAAPSLGVRAVLNPIHDRIELERAIVTFAQGPNGGLFFPPDVTVVIHRAFITDLVARHRLPAIYGDPALVKSGGLMAYGPDRMDIYRRAASYADRILHGANPANLPVQNPTKYEMILNLKTARTLSLEVPPSLLARADEVIE